MTDIENYLTGYYYASKDIPSLEIELDRARQRLEDAYVPPNMAVNPKLARIQKSEVGSLVEKTVILIHDDIRVDIECIQPKIDDKRRIMAVIEGMISCLTEKEKMYVRLRYFENRSSQQTGEIMHYETSRACDIRKAALDKLQTPYEAICGKVEQIHDEAI